MKFKVFTILLCIATLFMGVGYASINSISLNVTGEMVAQVQEGVFITNITCYQEDGYDNSLCSNENILSIYQTNMHSNITLENDINSTLTYQITIYNSTDTMYYFDEVVYMEDESNYSNENITFELRNETNSSSFEKYAELASDNYITFNVIFKFKENADVSAGNLISYLNFKFVPFAYTVQYHSNYPTNVNLIYNLDDCVNASSNSITYSINNEIVSVRGGTTANENTGYINARVDLEKGKSYTMSYDILYQSSETVQMWLIYDGSTTSTANYTGTDGIQLEQTNSGSKVITPQITGTYYIRLDINSSNNDYAVFNNLSVVENTEILNDDVKVSSHIYNQEKELLSNTFERNKLIFTGWNLKEDGSSTSYNDSQIVNNLTTVNNDVVNLYAQWTKPTGIAFDANGGFFDDNNNFHATNLEQNSTFEISEIPYRDDHVFLGWSENPKDGTVLYQSNTSININEGIVLYAIWEEVVEVGPITSQFISTNFSAYQNTDISYDTTYKAAKFTVTETSEDNGVHIKIVDDNNSTTLLGDTYPYTVIVYNVPSTSNTSINIFPNMDIDTNGTNYGVQYQWRVSGTIVESDNTWQTMIFDMYELENKVCEQKDGTTKTHTYKDKYIRGFRFDYFNGLTETNSTFYLKEMYLCKSIETANILVNKYQGTPIN